MNTSNSGSFPHLSVGQQFVQSVTIQPGLQVGDLRNLANGTIEMWDGTRWLNVSPNQLGPATPAYTLDLDAEPVDALALAIYRTYEKEPGANLPAARLAAADVIRSLRELGFVLTQDYGSVRVEQREDDFDFTDICSACEAAVEEVTNWHLLYDGRLEFAPDLPDRFCLFHRGYVMGQLA